MFEITIKEIKEVKKTRGKEWSLCGTKENAEYAYTPEIEKVVEIETQIYKQYVEELEITKVINAVNGTYI